VLIECALKKVCTNEQGCGCSLRGRRFSLECFDFVLTCRCADDIAVTAFSVGKKHDADSDRVKLCASVNCLNQGIVSDSPPAPREPTLLTFEREYFNTALQPAQPAYPSSSALKSANDDCVATWRRELARRADEDDLRYHLTVRAPDVHVGFPSARCDSALDVMLRLQSRPTKEQTSVDWDRNHKALLAARQQIEDAAAALTSPAELPTPGSSAAARAAPPPVAAALRAAPRSTSPALANSSSPQALQPTAVEAAAQPGARPPVHTQLPPPRPAALPRTRDASGPSTQPKPQPQPLVDAEQLPDAPDSAGPSTLQHRPPDAEQLPDAFRALLEKDRYCDRIRQTLVRSSPVGKGGKHKLECEVWRAPTVAKPLSLLLQGELALSTISCENGTCGSNWNFHATFRQKEGKGLKSCFRCATVAWFGWTEDDFVPPRSGPAPQLHPATLAREGEAEVAVPSCGNRASRSRSCAQNLRSYEERDESDGE
jgi:hypothetical protein